MHDRVLEHVGEPQKPNDRDPYVRIDDWEALLLARALREWVGYADQTETERMIAEGLAEYCNDCVRGHGAETVPIYAHTRAATAALSRAVAWNVEHASSTQAVAVAEAIGVEDSRSASSTSRGPTEDDDVEDNE